MIALSLKDDEVIHTIRGFEFFLRSTPTIAASVERPIAVILNSNTPVSSSPLHLEKCVSALHCFDGYEIILTVIDQLKKKAHFIPCRETMGVEKLVNLMLSQV